MELKSVQNSATPVLSALQIFGIVTLFLYYGKSLFIPLSSAFLISFLLFPLCSWTEKKGIPRVPAIILPVILLFVIATGLGYLLFIQIAEISYEWAGIKTKVTEAIESASISLAENLGVSAERQIEILQKQAESAGNKILSVAGSTVSSFTEAFVYVLITPIFSFLILMYRNKLVNAFYHFFPEDERSSVYRILTDTILTYYNFAKGMLVVYAAVGILNSIGLWLVGVPHPAWFGFTAAILTFIPYVGIMIGAIIPVMVVWVTQNSAWYPIAVLFVFGIVQILEAYLIFPLAVGKRLKINTLVVFVMIVAGGLLWGAAGMILFIPLIGIVKLFTDKIPNLRYVSDLLGD